MTLKKIIPFWLWPYSWGMKGKTREVAKAEYELTGFALEHRLLELRKDEIPEADFVQKEIELKYKYKVIDYSQYSRMLAQTIVDEKQRSLALLEIEYKEHKIGQLAYEKQTATIKGEPWVNVVNMDFNNKTSLEGSFDLDWNEHFVEKLRSEGYVAATPDQIINQWFMEVCRNVALEEFDGTGNFTADSEANLEAVKRWSGPESISEGRKSYK